MDIFQKTVAIVAALFFIDVNAVELVCKGYPKKSSEQRVVYVDCDDRRAVAEILRRAWITLQTDRQGAKAEKWCEEPFHRAYDTETTLDLHAMAPKFLEECNTVIQYIK